MTDMNRACDWCGNSVPEGSLGLPRVRATSSTGDDIKIASAGRDAVCPGCREAFFRGFADRHARQDIEGWHLERPD